MFLIGHIFIIWLNDISTSVFLDLYNFIVALLAHFKWFLTGNSNKFRLWTVLLLTPSVLSTALTIYKVPAKQKFDQSMLPPPCFTIWMVWLCSYSFLKPVVFWINTKFFLATFPHGSDLWKAKLIAVLSTDYPAWAVGCLPD